MNTQSSLAAELKDKEYRDAYVASKLRISLPKQCRSLRESRDMTQPMLAEVAGMTQPRISEIERPGERKLNLETLLRLASAFDVALQVRFLPFSDFVDDNDNVDLDDFNIPPFEADMAALQRYEAREKATIKLKSSIYQQACGRGQKNGSFREMKTFDERHASVADEAVGEHQAKIIARSMGEANAA